MVHRDELREVIHKALGPTVTLFDTTQTYWRVVERVTDAVMALIDHPDSSNQETIK